MNAITIVLAAATTLVCFSNAPGDILASTPVGIISSGQPQVLTSKDITPASDQLAHLRGLEVGWDAEDAPPPSLTALTLAEQVITNLASLGVLPFEIDADVLGGIALWFESADHSRRVWVSCMNQGTGTVVFTDSTLNFRKATRFQLEGASQVYSFIVGGVA